MATLIAAKAVDMPGIGTTLANFGTPDVTLDPVGANPTSVTFHSNDLDIDIVLLGTFNFSGIALTGTANAFELDIPSGTFAFRFSGLSLDVTTPGNLLNEFLGADQFVGSSFNDVLFGFAGDDILNGGNGNDTLNGGADKDILIGGRGRDLLTGGTERDLFDFNSIKDSLKGAKRDQILDIQRGTDDIDLHTIDAKTGVSGNNAFKFIGKQDFHDRKGELRYEDKGSKVIVQGDVNGDGKADFEILVKAGALAKGDFLL